MYRILIADDDRSMLAMVEQVLLDEGYDVSLATTVEDVLEQVRHRAYDMFLLDMALPGNLDSFDLCYYLRQHQVSADKPIMFLTGHREADHAIKVLEAGADDYLRKPFALRELTARIRAHLRRVQILDDSVPMLQINPETYQVYVDQREVHLTRIEFDLLNFMVHQPNKWHATSDLLAGVWNYPSGVGDTALVRNHIRNLRRKLEINPDHPDIIQSRHGRGYCVRANVEFEVAV